MDVVYLDNNATTRVDDEVKEAMMPYFSESYGNPSSMHSFGGQVSKVVEKARAQVANLIGAHPDEIVFTGCGTESDNAAIMGILQANPDKKHIITTKVEHPAVKSLCEYLRANGYRVTFMRVARDGSLNLDDLVEAINDDTALVSIMWANNETGVVFPVHEAARIAKSKGVPFHTDAVQAVGKVPVNVKESPIDLLSMAGHKIHAPKGIGALYVRKGTRIVPFLKGGHQEKGRRAGTENVASIFGFGKACELAAKFVGNTRIKELRDRLENGILEAVPNVYVNGSRENRIPNTTSVSFEYVEGEAILLMLNEFGICASSGSACTSGSLEPSHVLRAMGVPFTCSHGSIRFSLSRYTTMEEVDFTLEKLIPVIENLRAMSPFWQQYLKQGQASFHEAKV